jgi:crotonobetainyl-CoA:carnitine CoA-transferase CaiB-like acyl-CoA transferase
MSNFLSGITVVEFGGYLAGPTTGRNLAAMGANVIKIERPVRGDEGRWFGPQFEGEGVFFADANHGTRSVVIDLTKPAGLEVARDLASRADVVVENMRPSVMTNLGLSAADLMARNERLIYASINGFGLDSPRSDEPAYDPIIQAATGMMFQQAGSDDDPPVKVGVPLIDKAAALWSTIQILGAVVNRERTGRGAHVVVSLMSVGVHLMGMEILRYFHTGRDRFDPEPRDPGMATYQAYKCRDGRWIQVAMGNQRQFERLCEVTGHHDVLNDTKLSTAAARGTNRNYEQRILAKMFLERTLPEWLDILKSVLVPATAVNNISEFLADTELSKDYVSTARLSSGELVPMLLSPLDPKPVEGVPSAGLPRLGAHSEAVLESMLGMRPSERAELAARGAFGPTKPS